MNFPDHNQHEPAPGYVRRPMVAGPVGFSVEPRPMACVNTAMMMLDRNNDDIFGMVDTGELIAFDIARPGVSRKCLRILNASLVNYRATGSALNLEWPQIFRLVVPHDLLFLGGLEMQRYLNCDEGHLNGLIRSGVFTVSKKATVGRSGSPIVTRASFETWLHKRLEY